MRTNLPRYIVLLTLAPLLGGCMAAAITAGAAGAAGTASVSADRRTVGTVVDDEAIELKARKEFLADKDLAAQAHINVTSFNGRVLLTGEAPTEILRTRAGQLVAAISKVSNVHNEITIAAPSSLTSRTSDTLITSKVKTKIVADEGTSGFHVKVVTENGVVYLMGLVSGDEANDIVDVARNVGGVQRVVNLFEPGSIAEAAAPTPDSG